MKFKSDAGKRNRGDFPARLTAADIPTLRTVLTIDSARGVETVKRPFLVIVFAEYPDKEFTTNAGQTAMFGDMVEAGYLPDPDVDTWASWKGRKVAFEKRDNTDPNTGATVVKLYPLPASQQVQGVAEITETLAAASKAKSGKAK